MTNSWLCPCVECLYILEVSMKLRLLPVPAELLFLMVERILVPDRAMSLPQSLCHRLACSLSVLSRYCAYNMIFRLWKVQTNARVTHINGTFQQGPTPQHSNMVWLLQRKCGLRAVALVWCLKHVLGWPSIVWRFPRLCSLDQNWKAMLHFYVHLQSHLVWKLTCDKTWEDIECPQHGFWTDQRTQESIKTLEQLLLNVQQFWSLVLRKQRGLFARD